MSWNRCTEYTETKPFGFGKSSLGTPGSLREREKTVVTIATAARAKTKMSDSLARIGLFFDELHRIRIWEPEAAQSTSDLRDECKAFGEKITEFFKTASEYVTLMENLAKHVEQEKIKALGSSNLLKSMAKQRQAQQQQYQSLIIEKTTELERLRVQHQSLLKVEAEQQDLIDQIQLY